MPLENEDFAQKIATKVTKDLAKKGSMWGSFSQEELGVQEVIAERIERELQEFGRDHPEQLTSYKKALEARLAAPGVMDAMRKEVGNWLDKNSRAATGIFGIGKESASEKFAQSANDMFSAHFQEARKKVAPLIVASKSRAANRGAHAAEAAAKHEEAEAAERAAREARSAREKAQTELMGHVRDLRAKKVKKAILGLDKPVHVDVAHVVATRVFGGAQALGTPASARPDTIEKVAEFIGKEIAKKRKELGGNKAGFKSYMQQLETTLQEPSVMKAMATEIRKNAAEPNLSSIVSDASHKAHAASIAQPMKGQVRQGSAVAAPAGGRRRSAGRAG